MSRRLSGTLINHAIAVTMYPGYGKNLFYIYDQVVYIGIGMVNIVYGQVVYKGSEGVKGLLKEHFFNAVIFANRPGIAMANWGAT